MHPDERRVPYVPPTKLKEHLVLLFDRQVRAERLLTPLDTSGMLACFTPQDVRYTLGRAVYSDAVVEASCTSTIEALVEYLRSSCDHGMSLDDGVTEGQGPDTLPVLDLRYVSNEDWLYYNESTVRDVIGRIPTVTFKEQSDWYRVQALRGSGSGRMSQLIGRIRGRVQR